MGILYLLEDDTGHGSLNLNGWEKALKEGRMGGKHKKGH
jgi:hypothetical protein